MLGIIAILLSLEAHALELRHLGIEYHRFADHSSFPEIGEEHADQQLDLSFDLDLVGPVFWNNSVKYMTSKSTSILVGWNYQLGIRVISDLTVGYEHFSQHRIGMDEIEPHFPLYDAFYFEWSIVRSGSEKRTLF